MRFVRNKKKRLQRRPKLPQNPPKSEDARERKCIITGAIGSPEGFVRFVLGPNDTVVPDLAGKLPGRGAWVTGTRSAVEAAQNKGAFARSFKAVTKIRTGADPIAETVDALLVKAALNALGLARRSGVAAIGFDQVRSLLREGKAAALVSATDGAADGKRKIQGLAADIPIFELFESHEISSALGRDRVVHVAITTGSAATRFLSAARRLKQYRTPQQVSE